MYSAILILKSDAIRLDYNFLCGRHDVSASFLRPDSSSGQSKNAAALTSGQARKLASISQFDAKTAPL